MGLPVSPACRLMIGRMGSVNRRTRRPLSRKSMAISVLCRRLRISSLLSESSSIFLWCSALTVSSSSFKDWSSSFELVNSSFVLFSSSFVLWSSSFIDLSSSWDACISSTVRWS